MKFPDRTRDIEYAHDRTIEVQMLEALLRIEELLTPRPILPASITGRVSPTLELQAEEAPVAEAAKVTKKKGFRL